MANAGDYYIVSLSEAHLGWGTHRYTNSRSPIEGERYLPIPRSEAMRLYILNSNGTGGQDVPGENIFYCTSRDGFFSAVFKAQGCSQAGDIFAKQFSVDKDLKALKSWYDHVDAAPGDKVIVTWTSRTNIVIDLLR